MITFIRTKDCPRCSDIQEALEELVLAHEVVVLSGRDEDHEALPGGRKPPVLIDGEEVIEGSKAILEHLEHLEHFKEWWDKFQSDACYCDEEETPDFDV